MIRICVCLAGILLLPLCWGSAWQAVWEPRQGGGEGSRSSGQSRVLAGWILFLAGFELLAGWLVFDSFKLSAVYVFTRAVALDKLTRLTEAWALILTVAACIILLFPKGRRYVRRSLAAVKSGRDLPLLAAFLVSFLAIAGVYLLQGFRLDAYQSVPEEVTAILQSGLLHRGGSLTGQPDVQTVLQQMYHLPALYAVFADLMGVRGEVVVFGIAPYLALAGVLLALDSCGRVFFERSSYRAVMLCAAAVVILCGSSAYMNVPYAILHAPYGAAALVGGMLLPYLFSRMMAAALGDGSGAGRAVRGVFDAALCLAVSLLLAGVSGGLLKALMVLLLLLVCILLQAVVRWIAFIRRSRFEKE